MMRRTRLVATPALSHGAAGNKESVVLLIEMKFIENPDTENFHEPGDCAAMQHR
jgi:hypothetical protein